MIPAETCTLLLHSNNLPSIPGTLLSSLSKTLTHLDLRNNHLKDLGGLVFPAGLLHLDLGFNELERVELGPQILPALEWLSLEGNKALSQLPASLAEMASLSTLNVSRCQLTALLPGMAKMKSLTSLFARDNRITSLPPDWAGMALTTIAVSDNFLVALPPCWALLPDLKTMFVGNNPLVLPPIEVCLGGVREIQTFLADICGGAEAMRDRKEALARAEAEATAARIHRDAAQAKLAEAEGYIERLRARAVEKEKEIRGLAAELEQMKRAVRARDSAHTAAREAEETIAALQNDKAAAAASLTVARSEARDAMKRVAELEAKIARLSEEAELSAKRQEAEAKKGKQPPAPKPAPAAPVVSSPLAAKQPSADKIIAEHLSKIEALSRELEKSRGLAEQAQAEAAQTRLKSEQDAKRFEATIRSLTEQVADQKADAELSKKALRDLERALDLR